MKDGDILERNVSWTGVVCDIFYFRGEFIAVSVAYSKKLQEFTAILTSNSPMSFVNQVIVGGRIRYKFTCDNEGELSF